MSWVMMVMVMAMGRGRGRQVVLNARNLE